MLHAGLEIDLESSVVPLQKPVYCLFPMELSQLRIYYLSSPEIHGGMLWRFRVRMEQGDSRLSADLNGLYEIHHTHVSQISRKSDLLVLAFQRLPLLFLQENLYPGDYLLYIDGLCKVIIHTQFQTTNLVLYGLLVGKEYEWNLLQDWIGLHFLAKLESIHVLHLCIRDNQIGLRDLRLFQRIFPVNGSSNGKPGLTEADLHDP